MEKNSTTGRDGNFSGGFLKGWKYGGIKLILIPIVRIYKVKLKAANFH